MFNNYDFGRQQDILEELNIETIKVFGHDVKYLPRTLVKQDNVWGEDALSTYNNAINLDVYIKNVEGFEGEGDFLSKFGIEIRDQVTFTTAQRRWKQLVAGESVLEEVGSQIFLESFSVLIRDYDPYRIEAYDPVRVDSLQNFANNSTILLETGTPGVNNYSVTSSRPLEGDILYLPLVKKLFEIKFVEHEEVFYQTGRLHTYDLRCELFEYSSERIDTGNTEIDAIETTFSADSLFNQMLLESGDNLLGEDGDSIMFEFQIESTDRLANNTFFQLQADSIMDFTERNPFSEVDRY
jgi:hypothetical protein